MQKILIVNYKTDILENMKEIFSNEGYETITACNGKECLGNLKSGNIDIVLLDIEILDMSGWEVYKEIRKTNKSVKVVFISGFEVSKERLNILFQDGIQDYITKPFSRNDLINRIRAIT